MPMRLIVRAGALVVTSGIAVTALVAGPQGGIPTWGTGLVLSIVLLAVAAGAALDVAEWKEVERGGLPHAGRRSGGRAWAKRRAADAERGSARARRPGGMGRPMTPLWPLRVGFTLRYKTSGDVLTRAFSRVGVERARSHDPLDARRMAGALFRVWRVADQAAGRDDGRNRLPRTGSARGGRGASLAVSAPVLGRTAGSAERPPRGGSAVPGQRRLGLGDLATAPGRPGRSRTSNTPRSGCKAVYLSFDDEDFRQPPRFETLHLCFGEPARCVFSFTADPAGGPVHRPGPGAADARPLLQDPPAGVRAVAESHGAARSFTRRNFGSRHEARKHMRLHDEQELQFRVVDEPRLRI